MKSLSLVLLLLTALQVFASSPFIRVLTTLQEYNLPQPWEKKAPHSRSGLGVIVGKGQVLTTAEMVANATYLELETPDAQLSIPAKILAVDYQANLALLTAETPDSGGGKQLAALPALDIAAPAKLHDEVELVQVLENGRQINTKGSILSADVISTFLPEYFMLSYVIKAPMQNTANSYTIPALHNGKLLGMLTNYKAKEQLLDITAPEIVRTFLDNATNGQYQGFPSIGISVNNTEDPSLRAYFKIPHDQGGLFIQKILRKSPAQTAGIEVNDILLSVDGHAIDRKGYYQDAHYGPLYWSHLIKGYHSVGDTITLTLLRDGKELKKSVHLTKQPDPLIATHIIDRAPRYLFKGGFIFQELSKPYLEEFGKDWQTRAPLTLLDAYNHPQDYENQRKRIVVLSRTIPTRATIGYERVGTTIVNQVNGKVIADIPSLVQAFEQSTASGIHTIELMDDPKKLYLSEKISAEVDKEFLAGGLPSLSRTIE